MKNKLLSSPDIRGSLNNTLMASFATFVSELVYNNSQHSDVILEVEISPEPVKYHLILDVIKKYAPKLHEEFEKIPNISLQAIPSDLSPEQLLLKLTSMLHKPKKTLKITDLTVCSESLDVVLKSMYVSPVHVTPTNCLEIYKISTRFGMEMLSKQCLEDFKKTLKTETLLVDYQKIRSDPSPMMLIVDMYQEFLINNLSSISKDQLLDFTSKLGFASMLNIVENETLTCCEDLVYEMVERWSQFNIKQKDQITSLMSNVKLELLSNELLLSKVKANESFINPSTYLLTLERRLTKPIPANSNRSLVRHIFALGKLDQVYSGYRLITDQEVVKDTFVKLFKEQYNARQGVYCLDSFDADVVCCHKYRLGIKSVDSNTRGNNWLRVSTKKASQWNYARFNTTGHTEVSAQTMIHTITTYHIPLSSSINEKDAYNVTVHDNTGLFVKESVNFS